MRVNPDNNTALLAALERVSQDQQKVLKQLSSGLKVQTPSDDPSAAAALVNIQADDAEALQYLSNVKNMRMQMQAADSALNSVGLVLQRAVVLGVEGGTGTLSDADRSAIATELSGIKDQLLELANSSLQGTYLFSGTKVTTAPYAVDGSQSAGIDYQGNSTSNQIEVGQGYWIRANVPGISIFGDGQTGTFKALSDLITAVQNNTGVDVANGAVRNAIEQVSVARVHYGNAMNQLDSAQDIMNNRHIQLQQQVNNLAAVDMAQAASNLVSAETSRNALLDVISRSTARNLFDYLSNG